MSEKGRRKSKVELERQRRIIALGLCVRCRAVRNAYARLCDACALRHRLECRAARRWEVWRPGGRGRPPRTLAGE